MRDALVLELRVLTGRHAGACVAARDGLLLGIDERADVILTDLAENRGLTRLHLLDDEHWLLFPADVELDDSARDQASRIGVPLYWGGLALCVSAPHTDWPAILPEPDEPSALMGGLGSEAVGTEAADEVEGLQAASALENSPDVVAGSVRRSANSRNQVTWLWFGIALIIALALLGAVSWMRLHEGAENLGASVKLADADLTEQAQRQVPDLALTIARVDPSLRLQLTPQRDGRVQVSGWVDTVAQFDRLADGLGSSRPAPQMRVFVVGDVRAELRAQLAGTYPQLDFAPGDPGVLRIRGILLNETAQSEALAAVQALLPRNLKLESELRLAEGLQPDVASALKGAGFSDVRVHWNGSEIVAALALPDSQRAHLERTIINLTERFPGLPLRVVPELVTVSTHAPRAKPPFPIRGVIGGEVPYLVLPDGGKLLPGGTHDGWRLQSIDEQVLVFDMPRRLVVER